MQSKDYAIDKNEVMRYLGYRGQTLDAELEKKTDAMINRCLLSASPAYVYRVFDIEQTDNGVRIKDSDVVFSGDNIKRRLSGAPKCALLAVTLGAGVERELNTLQYTDMTGAVIFNAACTALTEEVADRCCREIADKALESGYTAGARYSPGYGDFPLLHQRDILSLLDAARKLGITLTDSLLMVPRKSVTAVVGFSRDKDTTPDGCGECGIKGKCEYERRTKNGEL